MSSVCVVAVSGGNSGGDVFFAAEGRLVEASDFLEGARLGMKIGVKEIGNKETTRHSLFGRTGQKAPKKQS